MSSADTEVALRLHWRAATFVTVHCAQSQLVKFLRCHPTASALEQVRRWQHAPQQGDIRGSWGSTAYTLAGRRPGAFCATCLLILRGREAGLEDSGLTACDK